MHKLNRFNVSLQHEAYELSIRQSSLLHHYSSALTVAKSEVTNRELLEYQIWVASERASIEKEERSFIDIYQMIYGDLTWVPSGTVWFSIRGEFNAVLDRSQCGAQCRDSFSRMQLIAVEWIGSGLLILELEFRNEANWRKLQSVGKTYILDRIRSQQTPIFQANDGKFQERAANPNEVCESF